FSVKNLYFTSMRNFLRHQPYSSGFKIFLGFSFFLLFSCARQGMPPGGPVDRTPPRVLKTIPPNRVVHVSRTTQIQITFSEKMDRASLNDALFFAPRPEKPIRLKWHGNTLSLMLPDSLLSDQTYLATIGTGAKDRHQNPLRESFTLAFSTGSQLDNGRIFGRAYGTGSLMQIQIWGYILRLTPLPDPETESPQYITQCDANGRFRFRNLSPGNYRLFAVVDREKNRRYVPGYDAIGFPTRDAFLTRADSTDGPLFFRIAVRDTTRPKIISVFATDESHLQIRMSEPVDSLDASNPENFVIRVEDHTPSETLAVRVSYRNRLNAGQIILLTARQDSAVTYRLRLQNIHNRSGNLIDSLKASGTFKGSAQPDTIPPKIVRISPPDSSRTVLPDVFLSCLFSEAMDTASVPSAVELRNAGGKTISGKFLWKQPDFLKFKPDHILKGDQYYRWHFFTNHMTDAQGNKMAEDSLTTVFRVVPDDTLSEISGVIKDPDSLAAGPIFLHIQQSNKPGLQKSIRLKAPGAYRFLYLLPGTYGLSGFRDENRDGRFSPGSLKPFQFSERFFVYPDTILVRSRWPNEGNDLELPK
ncbi:MAG TPA: hypothetical protein ENH53_06085, partial [Bacteroidetes bacterium]|nr:hypothetical protein [Bacteroidota bacterium]